MQKVLKLAGIVVVQFNLKVHHHCYHFVYARY